jgi:hypothetical protein
MHQESYHLNSIFGIIQSLFDVVVIIFVALSLKMGKTHLPKNGVS